MLRTTGLAALLLAITLASPAMAADADTQFWTTASAVIPLGDGFSSTAMVSQRFREGALGDDILLLRGTLDWKMSPTVALGGGLTYIESARGHEWRPHQQIVLSFDRLSLRTQLEERMAPGARTQWRLRERVQLILPIDATDRIVGSGEILYTARPSSAADHARLDSLRAYLALQHQLSPALSASAGYMLIDTTRLHGPDHLTHAPQVSLIWRL